MVEFFIFIILLLFALLGLSEALCILSNWLLKPNQKAQRFLLIFLTPNFAHEQLLQAVECLNWHGNTMADKILAYTGDLDEAEKNALRERFGRNKNIIFSNRINV